MTILLSHMVVSAIQCVIIARSIGRSIDFALSIRAAIGEGVLGEGFIFITYGN